MKNSSKVMNTAGDFSENKNLLTLALIAVVIGMVCSYIAKALLLLIYLCTNIFYFQKFSFEFHSPADHHLGFLSVLIPALGGLIIGLMARYGSDRIRGHGIPEALEAILFGQSKMSLKVAVLKPVSSAISIGSGGPFGAEGPIIMTGGAFGSIIAQIFHLTAAERKTLLVAGAAAGMSAIFASPVAAVLLAVELLLFEWKPRSLIPVAISSATAAVMRVPLFGTGPLFPTATHPGVGAGVGASVIFGAVLVGLLAGVLSTLLSGLVYKCEDFFGELPIHWMWWPVLGGLVVGVGGYFQPRALGVGYDVIEDLLKGGMGAKVIFSLIAVKCIIWAVSLGSGTSGGVLAPLLIMGGGMGALVGHFLPGSGPSLWPLIGMAAVLGGMMRSPFTGAIFALELTGDVNALLPLLTASVMGHAFTVISMKRSILTEKVARRGFHIFREYAVDILERIRCDEVMTKDVISIRGDLKVAEAFKNFFGADQKHLSYPAVDQSGKYKGMVTRDVLQHAVVNHMGNVQLENLFSEHEPVAFLRDTCRSVSEKMAALGVTRLGVVDSEHVLVGMITLVDLLKPKKQELHEEIVREAPLRKLSFPTSESR